MDTSRKRLLVVAGVGAGVLFLLGLVLVILFSNGYQNSIGKGIPINNFRDVVRNIPTVFQDEIEATLYTVVIENSPDREVGFVGDAFIRSGSYEESFETETSLRYGTFLVDIESFKQTYRVQFNYSSDETNLNNRGNASTVTCPQENELRFGEFKCSTFISRESTVDAPIIQHLPYRSISFNVYGIQENQNVPLILYAELNIPASSLSGSVENRRQTVTVYKRDVVNWIASKGFSTEDYQVFYSHNDDGVFIGRP